MISETTTVTRATTVTTQDNDDIPFAEATPIGLIIVETYGTSGEERDSNNFDLLNNNATRNHDDNNEGKEGDGDSWVSQWSDIKPADHHPTGMPPLDPRKVVLVIATLVFTAYLILVYYYYLVT